MRMRARGVGTSLGIAAGFFALATLILSLGEQVVPYRPGQFVDHDIVARVDFVWKDQDQLTRAQREAWRSQPRIYQSNGDVWKSVEESLLSLPDRASAATVEDLPAGLRGALDSGALTALGQVRKGSGRQSHTDAVKTYVRLLREWNPVVLAQEQRREDLPNGLIELPGGRVATTSTMANTGDDDLRVKLVERAKVFVLALQPAVVTLTRSALVEQPTHVVDEAATAEARTRARERVPSSVADVQYRANMVLVPRGKQVISENDWKLLRAENQQFLASLDKRAWKSRLGLAVMVALATVLLCGYIARYQPRVVRNHARGMAIAALLLAMMLVAELAGIGSSHIYLFGVAPTILVAMILTIAYEQRFAIGVTVILGALITAGLGQGVEFFVVILVGTGTCCFLLDDVRTRSKLIEVGGATAIAMIVATAAASAMHRDPPELILRNCMYVGAAGLAVGFVVLGILPFIEKMFRITTSMTLLELADASQPLLRRLAMEAPGTYNHSLQVATLAEAAAEAIRGNALLARVGSYYHDVGKINKADYFVENQSGGENRHINLSPSVSLLIIMGHVKDGIELAREYHLPTNLFPFIQQHHGTTLVEYFYHRAKHRTGLVGTGDVEEEQYRYSGPKPRSREIAIVMIADAVESACRAIEDPTASRIEALVHEIIMKRMLDRQFDECELTLRDLELIERSMCKTLLGIYHGRIAYPSREAGNKSGTAVRTA